MGGGGGVLLLDISIFPFSFLSMVIRLLEISLSSLTTKLFEPLLIMPSLTDLLKPFRFLFSKTKFSVMFSKLFEADLSIIGVSFLGEETSKLPEINTMLANIKGIARNNSHLNE